MDFTRDGRIFTHRTSNWRNANALSGFLFLGSVGWYFQRYFRVNRSIPYFVAFTLTSYFVASDYGRFVFLPVV